MISTADAFIRALRPIVEDLGATVVADRQGQAGDLPIRWDGNTVGYVRGSELHGALDRLVRTVERELGHRLADMDRAHKQTAVRRLDELGAFLLRGAVDDIAAAMGVSRVTLYTYLNAINTAAPS